jgi:hypothetical protein
MICFHAPGGSMLRPFVMSLLALPLVAQGTLFQEDTTLPPSLGVHLQVGLPRGIADQDLNRHIGFGLALGYPWHLGGGHLLRPNLEYNQYRITPQPAPAWTAEAAEKHIFQSWKLGIDYVLYAEPWVYRGPYALLGVGIQHSNVDFPVQHGTQHALAIHSSSLTSPWVGVGCGYQFTSDAGLELRYSMAAYAAERGQPLTSYTLTEPIKRDGRFLHLILVLRAPF